MTDRLVTVEPASAANIFTKPALSQPATKEALRERALPTSASSPQLKERKEPIVDFEKLRKQLDEAIAALNDQMASNGRGLKFEIDDSINRHIIIVSNTQTGEVVRQIPTEVVVRVAHSIEKIKGLLSDETV
jgi:flagellar protein FlaG